MQTLIKTNSELRQFVTASAGLEIATLIPFLTNSEAEREIIRVCGQKVYSDLVVAYNATPQTLSPAQTALLPYVQKPLANLALYYYVQQTGVIVSSSGITLAQDKEKQAYQWQQIKLEQAIINTGYYAIDTLISYLFAHEADFPDWKDTSEYYQNRNFFINTPQEFSKWVNIKTNYRTLVALRPFMRQIEYSFLKNALGADLFNTIKAQILTIGAPEPGTLRFYIDENGNLVVASEEGQEFNIDQSGQLYLTYLNMTPEVKELLADYIQPAVAHLSIARAIKELNFNITADGAFLQGIKAQSAANIQEVNGPDAEQRDQYSALHQQEGMEWLSKMTAFLNAEASAEKYADYYNSSLYVAPEDVVQGWKPDEDSKIWY